MTHPLMGATVSCSLHLCDSRNDNLGRELLAMPHLKSMDGLAAVDSLSCPCKQTSSYAEGIKQAAGTT